MNPLLELQQLGQNIWLDALHREMLHSGELVRLIREDGLGGLTCDFTAFTHAIENTDEYAGAIYGLVEAGATAEEIYQRLRHEDICRAADLFMPLYEWLEGLDGLVCAEISPHLAADTAGLVAAARQLWTEIGRPNLLVKIPATQAGLRAIAQLIAEGINVNATPVCRRHQYPKVLEAYLAGLEQRLAQGKSVSAVTSVASLAYTRIDRPVNVRLDELARRDPRCAAQTRRLRGQAAIASAKLTYQCYREGLASERFQRLEAHGAKPQFLVWTGPHDALPRSERVKYIEALVGWHTISAMPLETLHAYRELGRPQPRLAGDLAAAQRVLRELNELGIDLAAIERRAEQERLAQLTQAYDDLLAGLRRRTATRRAG